MDDTLAIEGEDEPRQREMQLERFVHYLTESQPSLQAYLVASLGNYDDAGEVLQRTNLALWRKAKEFRPDAKFLPWAVGVAKFELLAFYRDRGRDKHVFSEHLATIMLDTTAELFPDHSPHQEALRECMSQLPAASRDLINLRYEDGATLRQMSQRLNRTEHAVKFSLARIRKSLAKCIRQRIRLNG